MNDTVLGSRFELARNRPSNLSHGAPELESPPRKRDAAGTPHLRADRSVDLERARTGPKPGPARGLSWTGLPAPISDPG